MLKMTKIELELISDSDIYLFLMDTIRGGMTVIKNMQKLIIHIQENNTMNGLIKI